MIIIDAHIYNPAVSIFKTKKSDAAECWVYSCSSSDFCDLYKQKKCVQKKFMGFSCPYGKISYEKGPTRRARSFYSWISNKKELYKNTLDLLTYPENIMAKVGEYFYLPYAHMFLNTSLPVLEKSTVLSSGRPFIHEKDFTVDLISKIIKHRPTAMFGGEISTFQKKELPLFLKHLSEQQPELFNKLKIEVDLTKYISVFTNVGRKALLSSLRSGTEICPKKDSKEVWLWDGTFLCSTNAYLAFTPVKFEEHYIKIKPKEDSIIVITNENQVDDATIFVS